MTTVLLTVHILVVLALIGVVLLQRSEGGALGMGGGGGGFMTGRGAANALTRSTSVLGALFVATSLGLAILAGGGEEDARILEELTGETVRDPNAPATSEDLLRSLGASPASPAPSEPSQAAPNPQDESAPQPEAASPDSPTGAPDPSGDGPVAEPETVPEAAPQPQR